MKNKRNRGLMGSAFLGLALGALNARAANGPAYYLDFNTNVAGFGVASATNENSAVWNPTIAGTGGLSNGLPTGGQITIGSNATDSTFNGANFTLTLDGNAWAGLLINATNCTVTLGGGAVNAYLSAAQTWTVATGSTLNEANTRQGGNSGGLNFNSMALTLAGGGTINFITSLGANSGALITENDGGLGLTVNLWTNRNTTTTFSGGYNLTSGKLNFAAQAASNALGTGTFTINGGMLDNTSGAPLTLTDMSGITISNSFGFVGSSALTLASNVALAATPTITVSSNTLTMGGAVTGAVYGLVKAGAGTLALTSTANTYTGATVIAGGTLDLSAGKIYTTLAWADIANKIVISNGATAVVGGWGDGATYGFGSVSFNAADILVNGGTIRYTGSDSTLGGKSDRGFTIGVNGASLDAAGTGPWILVNSNRSYYVADSLGGNLTLTGSSTGDVQLVLTGGGSGGVIKNGTGQWTLSATNNTFTGPLTVNTGVLVLNAPGAGGYGSLVLNGGQLILSNLLGTGLNTLTNWPLNNITWAVSNSFAVGGATVPLVLTNNSGQGVALIVGYNTNTTAFNLSISDAGLTGSVVKIGSGIVSFNGLNSYSGGTIISNGVLSVSQAANLGAAGAPLTLAGGILQVQGTTLNDFGAHPLNGTFSGGFDIASPFNEVSIFTNLTGSGSLTKLGKGYLVMQSASTYVGGTTVSNGTLRLAAGNNTLSTNGAITVAGGTLDLAGSSQTTTNTVSFQGGIVQNGALIVTDGSKVIPAAGVVAVDLTLQGNATLNKNVTGTLTLLGNNSYLTNNINAGVLAVVSDQNLATNSVINFGGGTLQVLGTALTNLDSHTLNLNAASTLDINNAANTVTLSNPLAFGNSLTKAGAGTLVLAGNNSGSSPLTNNAGTLILTGDNSGFSGATVISGGTLQVGNGGTSGTMGTGLITVGSGTTLNFNRTGSYAAAQSISNVGSIYVRSGILTFSGTINNNGSTIVGASATGGTVPVLVFSNGATVTGRLYAGSAAGNSGVIIQNGGAITAVGQSGADNVIGSGAGSYGAYLLNGGSLTSTAYYDLGNSGGVGLTYQTGGGAAFNSGWLAVGMNAGGTGVVYTTGGSMTFANNILQLIGYSASGARAEFTVAGGNVTNQGTAQLGNGAGGTGTAILNLNGGTFAANGFNRVATAAQLFLNFNGGTYAAYNAAQTISTLNAVTIYGGGAFVDTTGGNITWANNLAAPAGNGITNISFSGSGYTAAPYVQINGGGGSNATAVALLDGSGNITNIVITSPGLGYTSLPTITLIGGGGSGSASALIGTNTTSGSLTKLGSGNLILSGTNTYGGGSIISNGLLQFNTAAALPATGMVTINALGAAAFNWAGLQNVLTTQVNNASAGAIALVATQANETINFNTAGLTNAFLGAAGGNTVLYTGSFTPYTLGVYNLGGGNGTLVLTNDLIGTTLTAGTGGGQGSVVRLDGNNTFTSVILNPNTTLSIASEQNLGSANPSLTVNGGTVQIRGTTLNSFNNFAFMSTNITGDFALDINYAGNTFSVTTNLTLGGMFGKLGAGTLMLGGSNSIAGAVTISAGALRLTNRDALDGTGSNNVTVASGAALQLQGGVTLTNALILSGTGLANDGALRSIAGNNTWSNLITLSSPTRINADTNLLMLAGTINNGGNALTMGGTGNTLISGAITNTGSLTKDGSGTLTLTGSNTYTGATTINAGGLTLDFSQSAVLNNIIATNSALAMGGLGTNATLMVIGQGSGVTTQAFNGVTINPGNNFIIASNYLGGGALTLNLGSTITRSVNGGGALDLSLPGGSGAIITTQATNTTGIFDSWVTINQQDWAAVIGTTITNYTGYSNVVTSIPNLNTANGRIYNGSSVTNTLGGALTQIKTVLVNDPTTNHVIAMAGQRLSIGNSGALMLASGSGSLTIGTNVNDGFLTGLNDLALINYSTNNLVINSAYTNNAGPLTINGGGPVIFNGTNASSQSVYINSGTVTFNNTNNLTGSIYSRGGTMNFANASTNNLAAVYADSGTVQFNGPSVLSSKLYAGWNGTRGVVQIATNLTAGSILQGSGGNASAVFQTGGNIILTQGDSTDTQGFILGYSIGGYGYFNMSDGSLSVTNSRFVVGSGQGGNAVVDMTGGLINAPGTYLIIGRGAASSTNQSVLNVFGGTVYGPNTAGNFRFNNDNGGAGRLTYGILNIANGGTVYSGLGTNQAVDLASSSGNIGVLNLLSNAVLNANQVKASSNSAISLLNFNGGTLLANSGTILSNTFLQGLSAATIYSGGAIIDSSNNNIIVNQSLVSPTGYGLTSIALATNGAGYIGAPAVLITGGSGTGATAIAQVNLNNGQVTNILITSAGSGYLPNDTVSIQLLGGGFTQAATLSNFTFAANTSGGLTKLGVGTLTLAGTNTYGGPTVVSNGVLTLTGSSSYGGLVNVANGTMNMGSAGTNILAGGISAGAASVLNQNGTGLTLIGGSGAGFLGALNVNTGVVQFANSGAVPVNTNVTVNAAGTVAFSFGGVQAALASGVAAASPGVIALTSSTSGESINFNALGMSSAYLGAVGTVSYDLTNHTPAVAGAWQLGGGGGTLNLINTAITNSDSVTIGNGVNAGTVVFNAANTHSGATTINSGSTLKAGTVNTLSPNSLMNVAFNGTLDSAGNSQTLGSLTGNGSLVNSTSNLATLTIGADNASAGFTGTIYNAHNLVKVGGGVQTLANSQAYSGSTLVSNGTLRLASPGAPVSGMAYWLNAANTATLITNAGGQVLGWLDSSINNNNFTNYNNAQAPALVSGALNGQAVVRFQGGSTITSLMLNASVNAASVFIINTPRTGEPTLAGLWGSYSDTNDIRMVGTGSGQQWQYAGGNAAEFLGTAGANGPMYINGIATNYWGSTIATSHLLEEIRTNGAAPMGNTSLAGNFSGRGFTGDVAEVVVYSSALTDVQRRWVETYLMAKYGLAANILPVTTVLSLANGSTLDLNGINQAIVGLSDFTPGSTGFITNGASAATSILALAPAAGSNYTFSGTISDAGAGNAISLVQNGPGTQILAGNNTYSGGTVINTGVLQFAAATAVSPNSNITINAGGAAAFDYAPFQNQLTNMATTSAGVIALTTNSATANLDFNTLNLSNAYLGAVGNVNYSGSFTNFGTVTRLGGGGGTLTFNQAITNGSVVIGNGLGTVILNNNNNSYTGTVLNAGILQVLADTNLGAFVVGQTNITFAGNSTLQAGGNLTLNAGRTILVTNGVTATLDDNGNNFIINGNIIGAGSLTKIGAGTLVWSNNVTTLTGGSLTVKQGTFTLTNAIYTNSATSADSIGFAAGDSGKLTVQGNSSFVRTQNNNANYFLAMGYNTGSTGLLTIADNAYVQNDAIYAGYSGVGAVYQTGGTNKLSSTSTIENLMLGRNAGGYGFYQLNGGLLSTPGQNLTVGYSGLGVFYQSSGVNTGASFYVSRGIGGTGVVYITGGTFNHTGMNFGSDAGACRGELTMAGGTGIVTAVTFGAGTSTGTGILNLNGGVFQANSFAKTTAAAQGYLNLNGGTLLVGASSATFLQGINAANVYSGGAIIDTTNNAITINQALLAPTGSGVTNIAFSGPLTGYLGAPYVQISGGSGVGATAVALFNSTNNTVTGLLITSAGTGYQPGDQLTATLIGGGNTNYVAGVVSLGANTNTGGLVKLGSGTLALGGNNTYGGDTVISNGNLQIGSGGTSGSLAGRLVMPNTNSWLGFNRSEAFFTNSLSPVTTSNIAALVQNGANILVLTNTAPVYNSTSISNGAVFFATTSAIPNKSVSGVISLVNGGGVAIGGAFSTVTNLLTSGLLTNNMTSGTLALMTGGNNENISLGVYTNLFLGTAPGQVATFLGTLTPATGTTNLLVRSGNGGTLIIGGDNTFTDGGSLTNRALVVGSVGSNSTVQILGPQSYSGGTTVTNATLAVSADNNLGYGGITLQNNSTLQITNSPNNSFVTIKPINLPSGTAQLDVGGAVTGLFYGAFSGGGIMNKVGTGTLELGGAFNAAAAGAYLNYVYGGTLWLASGSSLNNNNGAQNLILMNGTTMQVDSNATAYVQSLYVNNSTSGTAVYNQTGGSVTAKLSFIIGVNTGSTGTVTITGGSVYYNNPGGAGAFNLSVGANGVGSLTITNATITGGGGAATNGIFYVGQGGGGSGVVYQLAGSVVNLSSTGGGLSVGAVSNSYGTYNLNGGTLITPKVSGAGSSGSWLAAFNFNGGTLQANANNPSNFMQGLSSVNVSNLNGGAYIDSSNFVIAVSNNMSGNGALNKQGLGTLVLAGSNTYGKTTINAGTLWFASTQAINGVTGPGATNITINTNGTLAAAGAYVGVSNWLASGRIATNSTGAIGMITNNSEDITMTFSNLYLGVVAFSNVQYSGNLTPTNGAYRLAAGYLATNVMMRTNALTGSSGLLVAGPGIVTLASSNSYTGGTLIQSGAMLLLSTNVAAGTGKITNNFGGVLVAGYALDQTTLTNLAAASAGVVALGTNSANNLDFNAPGLANVSLGAVGVRTNSGTLTPYGSTYLLGGGGGTLVITNNTLTNAANLVAFGGGTGGTLILTGSNTYNGGTLIGALGTATVATVSLGTGAVTNNGTLVFNQVTTGVFGNAISGAGVVNITGSNGMVVLAGANTYAGLTTVASLGTLMLSNVTGAAIQGNIQIGDGGTNAYLLTGAGKQFSPATVLSFNANATSYGRFALVGTTQTVAGLNDPSGRGIVENTDVAQSSATGPATLIISNAANYVFAGYLRSSYNAGTSNTMSVIKDGVGMQILSGGNIGNQGAGNPLGTITIQNGILALSNTTLFASPVTINGGQLLLASTGPSTVNMTVITNNASDGLGFTGGNAFTIGGLSGTGGITLWSGTGGGVTLSIGSNNLSSAYSGVLSDAGPGNYFQGSLIKLGTGTLTLSGANTFNGYTVVSAGTLLVSNQYALGNSTLNYTNGSGALQFGAGLTAYQFGGLTGNGNLTLTNASNAGVALTIANAADMTYSGVLGDNSRTGSLVKAGSGTLTLSGTNTYGGDTTLSGGTLKMGANLALPTNTTLKADSLGATLDLNGYAQQIHGVGGVTGLGFNGTITNSGAERTLTVNFASGITNNFLGMLNGPGNLTLTGGGTMNLTGTNSFYGAAGTLVSNATYTVNGLHNGALITAYSNSTVGGTGPISGTLLVTGGTYQPGYGSVLTQAVATLILTNSGTLAVTLAQTNNPAYVTVSSQLTLAGTNNYLRLSNPDSTSYTAGTITLVNYHGTGALDYTNNYFRLADNINTIVGPNDGWALTNNMTFSVVGGSSSVTNSFTINYDDLANGVITLTAVPEPGTASLLGLVGLAFLVRRLRRRAQS